MSKIEWTGQTWNPLIGCDKISAGCKNCYAIRTAWIRLHNPKMAERYAGTVHKTAGGDINWTGQVNVVKEALDKPLRTKKPTVYFVNSMSDLFHDAVSFSVIHDIFNTMAACPQHTFQILTKRPERMLQYVNWFRRGGRYDFTLGDNVWIGVSVEDQKTANERILALSVVPAKVRFLSCEPLLGPIDLYPYLNLTVEGRTGKPGSAIDWVIVGGESGHGARPMHPDWARSLRDQCTSAGVPFFFKQWGEYWPGEFGRLYRAKTLDFADGQQMVKTGKKKAGRLLDGQLHDSFPLRE
jgi:protein gp37